MDARFLALRFAFVGRLFRYESLLYLVRVQGLRLFLVRFIDVLLIGIGLDTEKIVECDISAFGSCYFVAQAKDFLVWWRMLVSFILDESWQEAQHRKIGKHAFFAPGSYESDQACQKAKSK